MRFAANQLRGRSREQHADRALELVYLVRFHVYDIAAPVLSCLDSHRLYAVEEFRDPTVHPGTSTTFRLGCQCYLLRFGAKASVVTLNMASTEQLPQTAQVREMEDYINNSDFQQVHSCGCLSLALCQTTSIDSTPVLKCSSCTA